MLTEQALVQACLGHGDRVMLLQLAALLATAKHRRESDRPSCTLPPMFSCARHLLERYDQHTPTKPLVTRCAGARPRAPDRPRRRIDAATLATMAGS